MTALTDHRRSAVRRFSVWRVRRRLASPTCSGPVNYHASNRYIKERDKPDCLSSCQSPHSLLLGDEIIPPWTSKSEHETPRAKLTPRFRKQGQLKCDSRRPSFALCAIALIVQVTRPSMPSATTMRLCRVDLSRPRSCPGTSSTACRVRTV